MLSEPGLTLTIYAAEPASRTAEALSLLASWTAPATLRPATTDTRRSRVADSHAPQPPAA